MNLENKLNIVVLGTLAFLIISSILISSAHAIYEWTEIWNPLHDQPTALTSVYMLNSNDGWSVGWEGVILHWNGIVWEHIPSPVSYDLFSVHMINSNNGWAVGAGGAIIHWNGTLWETVPSPSGMRGILRSVFMIASNEGWAVGGSLQTLREILYWDGNTWTLFQQTPDPELTSVFMLSSTDGWAVGYDGKIIHWNGKSWDSVVSPTDFALWDIFMLSVDDGWAVGTAGTILHWDGTAWSLVTSPTTSTLQSIYMLSPNDGWAVGEDIIHWNGSQWSIVSDPLDEGYYFSLHMLSSDEGWAVGRRYPAEARPRIIYYGVTPPTPPPQSVIPEPPIIISIFLMLGALGVFYLTRDIRPHRKISFLANLEHSWAFLAFVIFTALMRKKGKI